MKKNKDKEQCPIDKKMLKYDEDEKYIEEIRTKRRVFLIFVSAVVSFLVGFAIATYLL